MQWLTRAKQNLFIVLSTASVLIVVARLETRAPTVSVIQVGKDIHVNVHQVGSFMPKVQSDSPD